MLLCFYQRDWNSLHSLNLSPFEGNFGLWPKSTLDSKPSHEKDVVQTFSDIRNKLEKTFWSDTFFRRLVQARQAAYNKKRYTTPCCKVWDKVYLSKKLFTVSSSSKRPPQKLGVPRVRLYCKIEFKNKNLVQMELPNNISIHPVTCETHRWSTSSAHLHKLAAENAAITVFYKFSAYVVEMDNILAYGRRGQKFQFHTQFRNSRFHVVRWKLLRDVLDPDGTITETLHTYIEAFDIQAELCKFSFLISPSVWFQS